LGFCRAFPFSFGFRFMMIRLTFLLLPSGRKQIYKGSLIARKEVERSRLVEGRKERLNAKAEGDESKRD